MNKRKIYSILAISAWALAMLGALAIYTFFKAVDENWLGWFGEQPGIERLQNPSNELASEVYTADGELLGKYFRENRTNAAFHELSPNLIAALYATEDIRFDEHPGIDLKGVLSIGWYLIQGKKRGGSTITQQLAKNLYDTRRDKSLEGSLHGKSYYLDILIDKAKEWLLAVQLEQLYTKKEIMTLYFNTVDYGSNSFGIRTAAQTFFKKSPDSLRPEEAAVLVGVLKAPTYYSPVYSDKSYKNCLRRRNLILDKMAGYGFIPEGLKDILVQTPINLKYNVEKHYHGEATYFREELKKFMLEWSKEHDYDLFSDGLRIYTTLDSRMQHYAENAVSKHMDWLQEQFNAHWSGTEKNHPWGKDKQFVLRALNRSSRYRRLMKIYEGNKDSVLAIMEKPVEMRIFTHEGEKDTVMSPMDSIIYHQYFLHAGLVSIQPNTGYIKAWVGGINYRYFQYDHVRQGRRQPGSAFKPVIYSSWLNKGYTPCYRVLDAPVTIYQDMGEGQTQKWTPKNAGGDWSGERLTIREGLARSLNNVSAYLIKQMGPEVVVENARKLGITAPLDPVPSLALGSGEVNVLELVSAYSTFVNLGKRVEPIFITRIEDRYGNVIQRFIPRTYEVFSPEVSYMMLYMMQGTTKMKGGTALRLWRLGKTLHGGNEVAAKTGTTNEHADGWFIGLTRDLATGVWVGGDDRSIRFRNISLGQGATMALPIWSYYMDEVYGDESLGVEKGAFKRPRGFDYDIINCQVQDSVATTESEQDSTVMQNEPAEELEF